MVETRYSLSSEGETWDNLTLEQYEAKVQELDEKYLASKTAMEQITSINAEIETLLDLRQQLSITKQRIKDLGYRIDENKPTDMYYSLKSKVFKELGLRLVATTPRPLPYSKDYMEEWLIPDERDEEIEETLEGALEDERETERTK
jgi:hypothetical protein